MPANYTLEIAQLCFSCSLFRESNDWRDRVKGRSSLLRKLVVGLVKIKVQTRNLLGIAELTSLRFASQPKSTAANLYDSQYAQCCGKKEQESQQMLR